MIKIELLNNPGYPTTRPEYYGTIHHSRFGVTGYGVAASVNTDYKSTLLVRRYLCGLEPPNYPVPARLIEFEYWPEPDAEYGRPALYGFDHYKPGRWFQFLCIE